MFNPYYNPDKLGLELVSYDESGLFYEYNTLCFWATQDGRVFTAQDSGCSCPTPFEGYSGATQKEVLQGLEQVGSPEQAVQIAKSWGHCSQDEIGEISRWVKSRLEKTAPNFQI